MKLWLGFAVVASVFTVSAKDVQLPLRASFTTNATACLQKAIDEVSASGGGTVTVPAGQFIVASLKLKDNVTLRLSKNAVLLGSVNRSDYDNYLNEGDTLASVIHAEKADNVAVVGEGVVDGRGRLHHRALIRTADGKHRLEPGRNILYFHGCRNVRVEGVTLRCGSSWSCHFRDCDGVVARKVKIWSHCNRSNDGFDIESRNVLIEDCDVDTEDDSLVVKAREPESVVENIVVRRCRLSSNAEHIKIGTETLGTIRNVLVEDCDVACRTPMSHADPTSRLKIPGLNTLQCALSAVSLFLMDGGSVEKVTVRNITVGEGIMTPICVRYGDRKPRRLPGRGFFRDVTIENFRMTAPSISHVACSIAGLPDKRPTDILLRDVELIFKGGGREKDAAQRIEQENAGSYPTPYHVFNTIFPAYAFYLRHADGVRFENVRFKVMDPDEKRPPIVADDAKYTFENVSRKEGRTLTMMSFNVRMGCGLKDPFKLEKGSLGYLPEAAKVIRAVSPDWVAVQEIDRGTRRAGGIDQTAELARMCGMKGTFMGKVPMPGGEYGLAILSREEPLAVSKIMMPGSVHPRAVIVAEFSRWRVACTHFPLDAKMRETAAEIIRLNLARGDKPLFLAGDINAEPDEKSIAVLQKGFTVLNDTNAFTYPSDNPSRCIDYIFVDTPHAKRVAVEERRVVAAPQATDHCAVVVRAKVNF